MGSWFSFHNPTGRLEDVKLFNGITTQCDRANCPECGRVTRRYSDTELFLEYTDIEDGYITA
jgi:hypothetical protein